MKKNNLLPPLYYQPVHYLPWRNKILVITLKNLLRGKLC